MTIAALYKNHWQVELFFDMLKSGYRVEALQLGAIERLERAPALFLVVACRIVHLMHMGRSWPDLAITTRTFERCSPYCERQHATVPASRQASANVPT